MVQGQTALFHAAQAQQLPTVDMLLSLGAATNTEASLVVVFAVQDPGWRLLQGCFATHLCLDYAVWSCRASSLQFHSM